MVHYDRINVARIILLTVLASLVPVSTVVGAVEFSCPPPATVSSQSTPSDEAVTGAAFPDEEIDLTIFAAASLTDAFDEIGDLIEGRYPNVSVTIDTAGSQTLVTQLGEGAQADVLATANTTTMRRAQDDELIVGEPVIFTANRLVIVTPPDSPAGIQGIEDLTGDDIRLVIAGEGVPAGRYARQAICAWAGDDDAARAAIGDNVVSEEVDVRAVLTKVLLGEADAGIVYASDAAAAELNGEPLNVIEFPEDIPASAAYPIAPVTGGNTEAARTFISFVLSDDGQQVLDDYGFLPVS